MANRADYLPPWFFVVWLMQFALVMLVGLIAALAIARYGLPLWYARTMRRGGAAELGFHVRGEDAPLIRELHHAAYLGARARLLRPRGSWIAVCEKSAPSMRTMMIEGAAFAHASLSGPGIGALRWPMDMGLQRSWSWPLHFGVGMWAAARYGRNFEEVLRLAQSTDPWYRYLCLDGYGYKFGLLDFLRQPGVVTHFAAVPGYYRRAVFQGLGRALYMVYLNDRRGLIEMVGDIAPEHDEDIVEGVAFSAAYMHIAQPGRVVELARAVPYEWRSHVHLGIVLGLRVRQMIDPAYLNECLSKLPKAGMEAIVAALVICDELETRVRADHPVSGYGLWRELIARRMEREQIMEPIYRETTEGRAGNKGLVM